MGGRVKIVLIFGTFDTVHQGHRDMFRQARDFGDSLFVVLARDTTVKRVKGRLPLQNERVRQEALQSESLVDEVVLGDSHDVRTPIRSVCPDVICLGYDQSAFTDILEEPEFSHIRVERLVPYQADRYKSSKVAKRAMREQVLRAVGEMGQSERKCEEEEITEKLQERDDIRQSQSILVFDSLVNEVDIAPLIKCWRGKGKVIFFPLVQGEKIVPIEWREGVKCVRDMGKFPTLREKEHLYWEERIDVALVPAVAIDSEGWRLGRGGGYYDRFLTSWEVGMTIGVVYSRQVVDRVPREWHDIKTVAIISGSK